jgi:hypothetical protein
MGAVCILFCLPDDLDDVTATRSLPLSEVEQVWAAAAGMPRIVFQMP